MANSKKREALNSTIDNIIKKVEEAGSWIKPFKNMMAGGVPVNYATQKEYNGVNIFNLWDTAEKMGYPTNEWLTFNQAKKLKGSVLKGQKATTIYFFKPIKVKDEDEEGGYKIVPMLKAYKVFNIYQTSLYIPKEEIAPLTQVEKINKAEDYFLKLNFLNIETSHKAYYSPVSDHIGMPNINNFVSAEEYYSTLGHEYIHATGHKDRLNRDGGKKFGDSAYAFEELVAELGSMLLMARLGLDKEPVQDNSAAYLKGWLSKFKSDKSYLWKAAAQASKAFNYLDEIATADNELVA